jgi:hypothetical protein
MAKKGDYRLDCASVWTGNVITLYDYCFWGSVSSW